MTRLDAKELNTHKSSKMQVQRWNEAVDKLFDYFGSRTCENCKYWTDNEDCKLLKYDYCASYDYYEVRNLTTEQNFGCNKFEAKND